MFGDNDTGASSGLSGYSDAGGLSGYSGYCGVSGYSGYCGLSGYSGYCGKSGYSGYCGLSGYSGYCGVSGLSGYCGLSGYSGYSGLSGYSGYCGLGLSGYSGFCGLSGYSGFSLSGTSGYSGFCGNSGYSGPGITNPALSKSTADNTVSSTTVVTANMDKTLLANGIYVTLGFFIYRSDTATTGVGCGAEIAVAGTFQVQNSRYHESTTNASTGAASQAAAGGTLNSGGSARNINGAAGRVTASVDTINSDMLCIVESLLQVDGTNRTYQSEIQSEISSAGIQTVRSPSSLIVFKTG